MLFSPLRSTVALAVGASLLFFGLGCPRDSTEKAEEDEKETVASVKPEETKKDAPAQPSLETKETTRAVSPMRVAGVKAKLDRHLRRWALRSPENTWALIHALLVYPKDLELPGHDISLVDAVLSMATTVEVGGRTVPTFTGRAQDGTPREPHANQVVMLLLLAGVELDYPFEADGKQFTVRDLVESALWRFEPPKDDGWEHEAWTLIALAHAGRHSRDPSFVNHKGQRFDGQDLVKRAADHLNREMEFIEHARSTGAELQKRREGVHSHPCGGLHLASAPAIWMIDTEVREALLASMERAATTLAWRAVAEHEIYEKAREEHPGHGLMVTAQEMKFYGHWLETMADIRNAGIEVDQESIDKSIAFLVEAVERLDGYGTFGRMEEIRQRRAQTYRDLIGDAAHALRGLRLWTED